MNCYASVGEILQRVAVSVDATALLLELSEAASRQVDGDCKRHFYTEVGAKRIGVEGRGSRAGESPHCVELPDDLLSASEVAVDRDGDGVFEEVWDPAIDYELAPFNLAVKEKVETRLNGRYAFPIGSRAEGRGAVQVTGVWGYGNGKLKAPWGVVTDSQGARVTAGVATADGSTLALSGFGEWGAVMPGIEAGVTLLVEGEQMFVSGVNAGALTASVERGVNGTTAAAHAAGSAVKRALYPRLASVAVINLVVDLWNTLGGADMAAETWKDYSYQRTNLATFGTFRRDQYERMIAGLKKYVIA